MAPDGIVTTVAGKTCGPPDESGDGGLATNACILSPIHFTMNPKGEWFILENYSKRIRKVGLDGIISTVVGGGNHTGFDDAPATSLKLPGLSSIQFSPDGEMFVTDSDQTEGNLLHPVRQIYGASQNKRRKNQTPSCQGSHDELTAKHVLMAGSPVAHFLLHLVQQINFSSNFVS